MLCNFFDKVIRVCSMALLASSKSLSLFNRWELIGFYFMHVEWWIHLVYLPYTGCMLVTNLPLRYCWLHTLICLVGTHHSSADCCCCWFKVSSPKVQNPKNRWWEWGGEHNTSEKRIIISKDTIKCIKYAWARSAPNRCGAWFTSLYLVLFKLPLKSSSFL